jgi:tyrosyl-tRNA synthetase
VHGWPRVPIGLYIGFDPTADSLHVGHLVGQLFMRRFQLAGHRPFPLAGGATGMIGDPGGRSEERNLLDDDTLRHNVECIKHQLSRLLDFEPGPFQATLVNNADWTTSVSMLEFLRDVGKHFTVNQMIAKDSVRSRIESEHGISYTEFSYMLLQANDFRHLYERHDVELQAGASDQWGNIVAGVELIRRRLAKQAFAITHPLMVKADGAKFGKSVGGAVWLDPAAHVAVPVPSVLDADRRPDDRHLPEDAVAATAGRSAGAPRGALHRPGTTARATRARRRTHRARPRRGGRGRMQARAGVLFGGDPTTADAAVLEVVAGEAPSVDLPADIEGVRVHELLARRRCGEVEQRGEPTAGAGRSSRRKSCARRRWPVARIRPAQRWFSAPPQRKARLCCRKSFPRG